MPGEGKQSIDSATSSGHFAARRARNAHLADIRKLASKTEAPGTVPAPSPTSSIPGIFLSQGSGHFFLQVEFAALSLAFLSRQTNCVLQQCLQRFRPVQQVINFSSAFFAIYGLEDC